MDLTNWPIATFLPAHNARIASPKAAVVFPLPSPVYSCMEKLTEVCYQALHHQLVASALVTQDCHKVIPGSQVGCMLTKLTTYARTCAPEDELATQAKNLENLFYADVQVWGEYPRLILKMFQRKGIHVEMQPEDAAILKIGRAHV